MKDTTKGNASTLHKTVRDVSRLLRAAIMLLTSVIAATLGEPKSREMLITASFVDARVQHEFGVFRLRIAEVDTRAFGVSAGLLAYTIDEEQCRIESRNGECREPLQGIRVEAVVWKPFSHVYAAIARTSEGSRASRYFIGIVSLSRTTSRERHRNNWFDYRRVSADDRIRLSCGPGLLIDGVWDDNDYQYRSPQ